MLISSFKLENGFIITPLFNFSMELDLQCSKSCRFVQYSPGIKFVQSLIHARRERYENLLSGIVAETMKLLFKSFYGYQKKYKLRHIITKY